MRLRNVLVDLAGYIYTNRKLTSFACNVTLFSNQLQASRKINTVHVAIRYLTEDRKPILWPCLFQTSLQLSALFHVKSHDTASSEDQKAFSIHTHTTSALPMRHHTAGKTHTKNSEILGHNHHHHHHHHLQTRKL